MKEFVVHINPISEFPVVHSDRLFGAICASIKDLYGEDRLMNMLEIFKKDPPFLLSSVFPYINQGANKIYFLPKPIENIEMMDDHKNYIDNNKKFENIKYVSCDIFNDWINGRIDKRYIIKNLDKYEIKDSLLFKKDKKLKFNIESCDIARNSVNRLRESSENLFYFEGNSYKNIDLFFVIRIYDHKYESMLTDVLQFLGNYRGFGKGVSVGKGKFEIKEFIEKSIFEIDKDHKRFTTLSRYIPSIDEINAFRTRKNLFYNIDIKRGNVPGDKPKKQVRFFSEGSTFPNIKNMYGRILYVHEKSVEYGMAFNVGMKI